MAFLYLIWDLDDDPAGNVQHCLRHNVTKDEVREVLENPTGADDSHSSGKPVAFGDTQTGRHLIVVYEQVDADTLYPITAYDVPKRTRP
jgi:uncharacterized DUF497 family protein